MWTPMWVGSAVALAAIPLYLWLGARLGIGGLALAGSLAISANALATLWLARLRHGAPRLVPLADTLLRSLAAALPAGAVAYYAAGAAARLGLAGSAGAFVACGAGGLAFAAVGLPLAYQLGDAPTRDVLRSIARRLRRR
jgi:peptidoglycan biosynthesis protein MviN/MurJ (putative lipid II flippase)